MEFLKFFIDSYQNSVLDQKTLEWWPVKYEWTLYLIFAAYLYFVLKCGPKFMEKRDPYSLKLYLKFYNIFQIVYNAWLVYASIKYGAFTDIGLGCALVDRSMSTNAINLANVFYYTLILKIIDLTETAVFVLRKKKNQISFLHLYHHISTIYMTNISVKYFPGGMPIIPLLINSAVHVIMYTYYLFSSQNSPVIQNIIRPIKSYITRIQIVQFFFLLAHTSQALFPSCLVPKWAAILMALNLGINLLLFYNFYRKNYKNKETSKAR